MLADRKGISLNQWGGTIATINFFLAGLLVLLAAGWSFVQKGCHSYYQREAHAFFEKIGEREVTYKNRNGRFLPFNIKEDKKAFEELNLSREKNRYFDFSVEEKDEQTIKIIATLKPEIVAKWYLHNPKTRMKLIYEQRTGAKGKLVKE